MKPAMVAAIAATLREHTCALAAALDALAPGELNSVLAGVAQQELP